jgi:hypothetical protein
MRWSGFEKSVPFNCKDYECLSLFFRNKDARKEFFIITSISEQEFLRIDEKLYFGEVLKELKKLDIYESEMDKNTSLLLLVEVNNNSAFEDSVKAKVLQVEENPYFFKKYVLEYKKMHSEKLYQLLDGEDVDIEKKVEELIVDSSDFRSYKLNVSNYPEYELLMRIMMKVPIFAFNIPDNSSVESISYRVINDVGDEILEDVRDLVEKIEKLDNTCEVDEFMKVVSNEYEFSKK